jgi:hypothetical protein
MFVFKRNSSVTSEYLRVITFHRDPTYDLIVISSVAQSAIRGIFTFIRLFREDFDETQVFLTFIIIIPSKKIMKRSIFWSWI